MKRLIFIMLIVGSWLLLVVLIALPENKYDWMIQEMEQPKHLLPIDNDSQLVVNLVAVVIISFSIGAFFCKGIKAKIRIPLVLTPCFGVLLKFLL